MKITVHRDTIQDNFKNLPRLLDADTIRAAVLESTDDSMLVETIRCDDPGVNVTEFRQRGSRRDREFVAVLCIPTGIGCEIGGHAGDAGAVARLIGEVVDTLVLHPNVVNGCDINEMPSNSLYVEGAALTRLMMGTLGLARRRKNKIGLYLEDHPDMEISDWTVNSVNAARRCYGADIAVHAGPPIGMTSKIGPDGLPVITVDDISGPDCAMTLWEDIDAWAIASRVDIDPDLVAAYFGGSVKVNPWGLVEAALTHVLGNRHGKPVAHAPMVNNREELNHEVGVVDPRIAAEVVSTTYINCVLKGLMRAPAITPTRSFIAEVEVEDIDALVIPCGVLGLSVWAAMQQGIAIIEVIENQNLMHNSIARLDYDKHYKVSNYLEAAGMLASMRAGIDPNQTRRL